jgi:hypothetical protein
LSGAVAGVPEINISVQQLPRKAVNRQPDSRKSSLKSRSSAGCGPWTVIGIIGLLVATLGLQHYYRVLMVHGSLLPSSFLIQDPDSAQFSPFLRMLAQQTRGLTALYLVLIFPILAGFLMPAVYRPVLRSLRERSLNGILTPVFLYLLAVEFYFSYSQIRYFATVTPCLYLSLPFLIRTQAAGSRTILIWLSAFSLLTMIATGFMKTQATPPGVMSILPALMYYFPPLTAFVPQ